jgi:hypothetical protein
MPNLLPNWTQTLPWDMGDVNLRQAGRLIWGILLLGVGLAFFITLLRAPRARRPFPTAVGIAIFPGIVVVGLVLGKLIPSLQRTIVWIALLALVLHGLGMVASRKPRDPELPSTWAECFAGAVGVFAMFVLGYAVIPSEWLNYANARLNWGDNTKFVFTSHMKIFGILGVHYPFNLDFPALRDIVVTMIYVVVLGVNLKLWVMWQHRNDVKPEPAEGEGAVARRSRFGRPLRRSTVTAGAAPEGA